MNKGNATLHLVPSGRAGHAEAQGQPVPADGEPGAPDGPAGDGPKEPSGPPAPEATAGPAPPDPVAATRPPARVGWLVVGATLSIVAVVALGFAANLVLLGGLRHDRDQEVRYARLRSDLANATAPVGQTDQNGRQLPLGTPLAVLEIPQIGLREVVNEGTTSGVLESGPGHRRDTPLPGQPGISVIMGRRATFGGPFRHLDELRTGDTFTVTTGQGQHTYRVIGLRRAGDAIPAPPASGHGRLILVTSAGPSLWPDGVLQLDCDLASAAKPAPPASFGSVPDAENVLGSDSSVWVPLMLWTQALLIATAAITWARVRWGRWQAWVVGVPVLAALGIAVANQAAALLPNLL